MKIDHRGWVLIQFQTRPIIVFPAALECVSEVKRSSLTVLFARCASQFFSHALCTPVAAQTSTAVQPINVQQSRMLATRISLRSG
jgi:hypothetical protein